MSGLLGEELGPGADRVVAEVASELADVFCFIDRDEVIVRVESLPVVEVCFDEAESPLGLPGVVEGGVVDEDFAVECEAGVGAGVFEGLADRLGEFWEEGFVGIEGEYPVAGAGFEGELFCFDIAEPVGFDDGGVGGAEEVEGVSVEPESMAMISSARSATESSVLPMVAAEFLQMIAMERLIGAMVECSAPTRRNDLIPTLRCGKACANLATRGG